MSFPHTFPFDFDAYPNGDVCRWNGAAWSRPSPPRYAIFSVSTRYGIFRGTVQNWRVSPVPEEAVATLECEDLMRRLARKRIDLELQESQRTGAIFAAVVAAGYTGTMVVDDGVEQIPYCAWHNAPAQAGIQELQQAERGLPWVDGNGFPHWEDRHHRWRAPHTASQHTYTQEMEPSGERTLRTEDVVNRVRASATPQMLGEEDDVWSLDEPFALGPGEERVLDVDYGGPVAEVKEPDEVACIADCERIGAWVTEEKHLRLASGADRGEYCFQVVGDATVVTQWCIENFALGLDIANPDRYVDWKIRLRYKRPSSEGQEITVWFGNSLSDFWYCTKYLELGGDGDWHEFDILKSECGAYGGPTLAATLDLFLAKSSPLEEDEEEFWDDVCLLAGDGVDLRASQSSDGRGDDLTKDVALDFTGHGAGGKLAVHNDGAAGLFVTELRVRGRKVEGTSAEATAEATDGELGDEVQDYSYDGGLLADPNVAQAIADYIAREKKSAPPQITFTFTAEMDAERMLEALTRDISDRITVTQAGLELSGKEYYIERKTYKIAEGGCELTITYVLSEIGGDMGMEIGNHFVLGESTFDDARLLAF